MRFRIYAVPVQSW